MFEKMKKSQMVSAIVFVLAGIVLVIWPRLSTQIVCRGLGAVFFFYGFVQIIQYVRNKEKNLLAQGIFVLSILFAVTGAWIIINPGTVIAAIPIVMGILIAIHGIQNIAQGLALKDRGYEKWKIVLILGIITVLMGAILIFNPFAAANMMVRMIGCFLMYDGISDLWIQSNMANN